MNRKEAGMKEEGGFLAGKELANGPQDADPKNRQGQEAGQLGLGGAGLLEGLSSKLS